MVQKKEQWVDFVLQALVNLGGIAHRKDIRQEVIRIRAESSKEIPQSITQTIQQTIQSHSSDSKGWNGKTPYFYSVNGIGSGEWGLTNLDKVKIQANSSKEIAYLTGVEGHKKEITYLRRTRNRELVQKRKINDDNKCQSCGFRLEVSKDKFIIDVHHLNPLRTVEECIVTKIEDLVCLCPNCHRIAHSKELKPMSVEEIKKVLLRK